MTPRTALQLQLYYDLGRQAAMLKNPAEWCHRYQRSDRRSACLRGHQEALERMAPRAELTTDERTRGQAGVAGLRSLLTRHTGEQR